MPPTVMRRIGFLGAVVLPLLSTAACTQIIYVSTRDGGAVDEDSPPADDPAADGGAVVGRDGSAIVVVDAGGSGGRDGGVLVLDGATPPPPPQDAGPPPPPPCGPGSYPTGPYGSQEGATMRNHSLQGYVDKNGNGSASDDGVSSWSLDQLYCRAVQGQLKALLVNISASWCSSCQAEQPDLKQFYAQAKARGVEMAEIMWDFSSQTEAKQWVDYFGLPFMIGFDFSESEMGDYNTGSVPINLVVNLKTMKIVWIGSEFDPSTILQLVNAM
jgi:thiol-disulfide isomerase/thioredoxin